MEYIPLVTVNILSFNRKEELRNTLIKVYEQNYKNIEVIVVDNASVDGTPEMVKIEFPKVILITLNKNIGIAGWNKGIEKANGDFILILDDDAYPNADAISKGLILLQSDPQIGCIAFNIVDLNKKNKMRTNWLPNNNITSCEWPIFVGCSALFRNNKAFIYMPEDYFLYQHELPVAANIYCKGFKIMYDKEIIAFHYFKEQGIYDKRKDSQIFKNNVKFIITYLPKYLSVIYSIQSRIFYFTRSIRRRWFFEYLQILKTAKSSNLKKQSISLTYFIKLRRLHLFNYSNLSKLKIKK